MIDFACPRCARPLKAADGLAGRQIRCAGCAETVLVPYDVAQIDTAPVAPPAAATPAPQRPPTGRHFPFLRPPQTDDELGRLGLYRILKVLGQGGMGVVFLAEDTSLNRQLALKVMLPEAAELPQARERFVREARAAAALSHDHVVPIYQVGEDAGVPFLTMPLLRGESLEMRLRREGALPTPEVLRIGREIAEGLAAAHERGMVHRDVKPGNIWLETPHGRVKLLDFGLARGHGDARITQSGALVGTPAYIAPEQVGRGRVDHRADLFSLGCVLYEMSAGRRAFLGDDLLAALASLATLDPPALTAVTTEAPAELSELVMQLLAKKPDDRPPTAQQVVERLLVLEKERVWEPLTVVPAASPPPLSRETPRMPSTRPPPVPHMPAATPPPAPHFPLPPRRRPPPTEKRRLMWALAALLAVVVLCVVLLILLLARKPSGRSAAASIARNESGACQRAAVCDRKCSLQLSAAGCRLPILIPSSASLRAQPS
jgi:serine/threonine protein kinase